MSILIDKKTKLIVQGITGRDGSFHAEQMKKYGTNVVGGVTPGKGGTKLHGIPVFDNMQEAVAKTKANTSVIYVPPPFAVDAIYEAVDAGIKLVVCITEGVPANDMMKVYEYVKAKGARLIGPNSPGLISTDKSKVGIMPGNIVKKGGFGVVKVARQPLPQCSIAVQSCYATGEGPLCRNMYFRRRDRRDDARGAQRGEAFLRTLQ